MMVLETPRLSLRWLEPTDDAFILRLLNQPGWLRFIGDKGVHTLEAARAYIVKGPPSIPGQPPLRRFCIRLRNSDAPLGICGLVNRDTLPGPDLGFALLAEFEGHGYAREAASAVLAHERAERQLGRVLAITSTDNLASQRLLLALGFVAEGQVRMSADAELLNLYAQQP